MKTKQYNNWIVSSHENFKTGINLGHKSINLSKTNFWHPLMSHYLLGIRNGIAIFNTQQTRKCLLRAFYIIALVLKSKGTLLLVNTNPEFLKICKNLTFQTETNFTSNNKLFEEKKYKILDSSSISYCCYKWVGGLLTNWKQISKSVLTFAKFSERCDKFLTKNNLDFPRYKKVKRCFEGLLSKKNGKVFLAFHEKPDLIFLMNPNENRNVIAEANKLHIPIIAIVESNTNLKGINFPIPANNYSANFIYFCVKKIIKMAK